MCDLSTVWPESGDRDACMPGCPAARLPSRLAALLGGIMAKVFSKYVQMSYYATLIGQREFLAEKYNCGKVQGTGDGHGGIHPLINVSYTKDKYMNTLNCQLER